MPLGCASLVKEPHNPVRLNRQIGDDETHTGEQLGRVQIDLGNDTAWLVPGRRLIVEILEEAFDFGQRGPPYGPRQPVSDLLAQDSVGSQPDGVEVTRFFQPRGDRGDLVGGVGPEQPQDVRRSIPSDHRVQEVPPAASTTAAKRLRPWTECDHLLRRISSSHVNAMSTRVRHFSTAHHDGCRPISPSFREENW